MPRPVPGEPGLFLVDATWGTIRPMELAPGVRTVGELEVIEHIRADGRLVDTRQPAARAEGTIQTAEGVGHQDVVERLGELDPERPIILFCDGPQCGATPGAVRLLLESGQPAEAMRYYRGGVRDWVTLGRPLVKT